ncbi:autotransporter beta-domain protein, partial [Chlamydia psittaci 06-1683]
KEIRRRRLTSLLILKYIFS